MFAIEPAFQTIQVVLVGQFNPGIIQPGWLSKHGIIGETEALNARVDVIHPDVTVLHLANVDLMVEHEKFTLTSKGIHFDVLRDFILKTFGEFLYHTPIRAMGINHVVHFDCGSFDAREEFAKKLAPREPWGAWGATIEGEADGAGHGGLTSIAWRLNTRPDDRKGYLIVRLEPSSRLQRSGIFMMINDHYTFDEASDSSQAMEVVELNWDPSLLYSESIINGVMANFVDSTE